MAKKKTEFTAAIEMSQPPEAVLPAERDVEVEGVSIWRAEVTFPFVIRVPIDIALVIGKRTITIASKEDGVPEALLPWLRKSCAHGNKINVL